MKSAARYLRVFVTASLADTGCARQGWVVGLNIDDTYTIRGQSGSYYTCAGEPRVVSNPPEQRWGYGTQTDN